LRRRAIDRAIDRASARAHALARTCVLAATLATGCAPGATRAPATRASAPSARLTSQDLLRRLGYADTARLVIIHADDMAMTPGVTRATVAALARGTVSSASILAPPVYLWESASLVPPGSDWDLGVHLALTSETASMRWLSAAGRRRARSLAEPDDRLPLALPPRLRLSDLERELRAQVARVRAAGYTPTHLDSHQGALLFSGPERFEVLRRVARAECLPIPVPESYFERFPYLAGALDDGQVPVANLVSIEPTITPEKWSGFYQWVFEHLQPGVTVLIVHLGEDSESERALFRDHVEYDAAWRVRDNTVVSGGALRALAQQHGARIVTWREVAKAARICMAPANP